MCASSVDANRRESPGGDDIGIRRRGFRSYNGRYWMSWISLLFILITAKLLHVPILYKLPVHIVYFIYWIVLIFINGYEWKRFMSYVKEYHRKKWDEITYIPFLGSGNYNGFRSLRFLFSNDNLDDVNVVFLKRNYRRFCGFVITVFIGFPVFSIAGWIIEELR